MPIRYIKIPEIVKLTDTITGKEIGGDNGTFSFEILLHKISDNPKWNLTYKMGQALEAIWDAWENKKEGIMSLSEEDWKELDDAVQNPISMLIRSDGSVSTLSGFGIHPRMARQLLRITSSVVKASQERPEELEKAA